MNIETIVAENTKPQELYSLIEKELSLANKTLGEDYKPDLAQYHINLARKFLAKYKEKYLK